MPGVSASIRCNRSSAGRSRGPANFKYWAGSHAIPAPGAYSGRIEGRHAEPGAPAMRLQAAAFQEIAEAPAEQTATRECGGAPRVEPGPRQERAASPIGPDLDPQRLAAARAASMEAE